MSIGPFAADQGGRRSMRSSIGDKVVTVEPLAPDGEIEITRLRLPRVALDARESRFVRQLASDDGTGPGEDALEAQWSHPLPFRSLGSASSGKRSATRRIADRARGLAATSVLPARTARFVTFRSRGR